MIKLDNVSKTYVSKSKNKVEALKNVNFELGSNGMTFILGKSGSGKSTLLNLLGGLDRPTDGHIEVDGASMQLFKQSDYESYRNSYVGFVFQEYNLLDDFNVKDNIALALQLSKDVNVEQKVVEALKQVELDEKYLTRRVGELSGGEKQRVAIARAIVKDSKMILADEPTGNLDSDTGASIWNILKTLSQTRPVVVVSHDRESAEQYSDRIIEIADGRVIADNGAEKSNGNVGETKFVAKKQRLSFVILLKMGFNSLFKRKAKTISIILVSVFTLCALLVSQIMLTFLPERSVAKYIKKYDAQYITLAQGQEDEFHSMNANDYIMKSAARQYIRNNAQTLEWGYVESKQQLLDFGLEFAGNALELDAQSFYITESALESVYEDWMSDNSVLIDGEEQIINRYTWPMEKLIGRQVKFNRHIKGFYTLAGVIKDVNVKLPEIFALEEFDGRAISFSIVNNDVNNDVVFSLDEKRFRKTFFIENNSALIGDVITDEGVIDTYNDKIALEKNEIVISLELFAAMFGGSNLTKDYLRQDGTQKYIIQTPSAVGKTVSLKFRDYTTGEETIDLGEIKIKGVLMDDGRGSSAVYFNPVIFSKVYRRYNHNGIIVKTDSVKNVNSFLVKLRTAHKGFVSDVGKISEKQQDRKIDVTPLIYNCEGMYTYGIILMAICGALVAVIILLMINLISFSIANRKKEIGILSAIGASVWDIIKIFLLETLVMSALIFFITLMATTGIIAVFNVAFSFSFYNLASTLTFYIVDFYAVLTLLGVCFVVLPLFALLPTIRIAKLKPIDAIRAL